MQKKLILRTVALLLLSAALLGMLACSGQGKTLLSLQKDGKTYTMSVNLYELLLSRIKGTLAASGAQENGKGALQSAFWDCLDERVNGKTQTLDEYYKECILDNCRSYLAAMYLFDSYGLSLSDSEKQEVEDALEELIKTDGGGSKSKLNSVLSDYYVNYDMLRELYLTEAKIVVLRNYLYDNLGPNLKQKYLEENYVHFRQIFLASYNYVYEKDENGDTAYYNPSDNTPMYEKSAYSKRDSAGNIVYYTDDTYTHYSYNTTSGKPAYKMKEDGTGYETTKKTAEELEALKSRAEKLLERMQDANAEVFEATVKEQSDDAASTASAYTDGYYLQKGMKYASSGSDYAYLDATVSKLETMETGDVAMIESTNGYHIIMKYDHTEGAYDKEENSAWFQNFAAGLSAERFSIVCADIASSVRVDEALLATVPSIKELAANYYY